MSLIGYVFDQALGDARPQDVMGFFKASRKAKEILGASDAEWGRLRPLMKAPDDATFRALRDSYRRGIPAHWGERERADARQIFAILTELGGKKLTGKSRRLQDGTFWPRLVY